MKRFLSLALLLLAASFLPAQTSTPLSRYAAGDAGCAIYLPARPGPVDLSYSPDSSKVYTIEALDSITGTYYHFGAIVVQLKQGPADEELVNDYMEYLQTAFDIKDADGTSVGYKLSTHPAAAGIRDHWIDKDGDKWMVMGWASEDIMIVQFVYGPADYPDQQVLDAFFKGVRFPGDH